MFFPPEHFTSCWLYRSLFLVFCLLVGLQAETEAPSEHPAPVIVASYNVENYLTMPRWVHGHYRSNAGKPEEEKATVANILSTIHPDIVAVMEMGDLRQFHELQRHLHRSGLDYPYSEHLEGSDPKRHLALLSHFPITEDHSQNIVSLSVKGKPFHSPRGILDVTITLPSQEQLRIIALHLKSKVSFGNYDQEALREAEALFLRHYIHQILTEAPKTHLLVMGDFNDTKNSKTVLKILGTPKNPDSLQALPLTDDRGESWTEYWKKADEYTRIDYMMVSKELEPEIIYNHSGIARPSSWSDASDHCAIFMEITSPQPSSPL